MDKHLSPVDWYVGSYLVRFVELADENNHDPESRFLSWENTVIVKAKDKSEAYDKVEKIGREHCEPYKGGNDGVDVSWLYVGITQLLAIYDELEDGSEIMWLENNKKKLKTLETYVYRKEEFFE
jgi:hypothetical protein